MPNYKNVTGKDLLNLLELIRNSLCSEALDYTSLCSCVIWLYEYCVCASYMLVNGTSKIVNKVATSTTIKTLFYELGSDMSVTINNFMCIRNGIAHGNMRVLSSMKISALLNDPNFYTMIQRLNVDNVICDKLKSFDNYVYFNAMDYFINRIKEKAYLLPEASVNDCSTVADCNKLLAEVDYLLQ